jgi:phytoene dehydrogenase-like protein
MHISNLLFSITKKEFDEAVNSNTAGSNSYSNVLSLSRREFCQMLAAISLAAIITPLMSAYSHARQGRLPLFNPDGPNNKIFILGSGITGLCAGALLAKIGYKVHVLEAHPTLLGGHARSFESNGLRFCAGPQYVWDFGNDGTGVGNRILRFLGVSDDIPFDSMNKEAFEHLHLGNEPAVVVPMGMDKFKQAIIGRFPEEYQRVSEFFNCIDLLSRGSKFIYDEGLYLKGWSQMRNAILLSSKFSVKEKWQLKKMGDWTLSDLYDHCQLSEKARRLLYAHGGMFVENESSVSVGVYAAGTERYHAGAFYPRYGFKSLIDGLSSVIVKFGGMVEKGKKVTKITVKNGKIDHLETNGGDIYEPYYVISTMTPRMVCKLIEACNSENFIYSPSNSITGLYIGVHDYPAINQKLAGKNYWWQAGTRAVDFDNPDMTEEPAFLYISSPTANGNGYIQRNNAIQSLVVFIPGNFNQAYHTWRQGKDAYESLKSRLAERILNKLENLWFPDLRQHLIFTECLTPLDLYQTLGAERGNAYGRKQNVSNVLEEVPPIPGIDNLEFACATVGLPGIATAFQTARILVERLSGISI